MLLTVGRLLIDSCSGREVLSCDADSGTYTTPVALHLCPPRNPPYNPHAMCCGCVACCCFCFVKLLVTFVGIKHYTS